eukprot:886178-Rhodomonas_salina.2
MIHDVYLKPGIEILLRVAPGLSDGHSGSGWQPVTVTVARGLFDTNFRVKLPSPGPTVPVKFDSDDITCPEGPAD